MIYTNNPPQDFKARIDEQVIAEKADQGTDATIKKSLTVQKMSLANFQLF